MSENYTVTPQQSPTPGAQINKLADRSIAETPRLKILIASTPKTGNLWLKYLLATAYKLPIVEVPMTAQGPEFASLGDRWVCHQHLFPTESLRAVLAANDVKVITTIRHPADVLVSYFHYVKVMLSQGVLTDANPETMMVSDGEFPGEHTLRYVREAFAGILLYSAAWIPFGSIIVRYEDLLSDPIGTLRRITNQFVPLDTQRLEMAVALCELNMLRRRFPQTSYHFRRGESRSSEPSERLSPEITEALTQLAPYPGINRRLGYSMDDTSKPARFDYSQINPLRGHEAFSNGVPIHWKMARIYLLLPCDLRRRWPRPHDASEPGSFFQHLLDPIDQGVPTITHLADYIYHERGDLAETYPDYRGAQRWAFINWFIYSGAVEYGLPQVFTEPIIASILATDPPSA